MAIFKNDYNKEGPGVGKDVAPDNGFVRFFKVIWTKFGQLVILNIVYLFACTPIVTIGPATAGLTYVLRNFSQGKPVFFMSDFIEKCKTCFKQGFLVTLIDAVTAVLIYLSFMFWSDSSVNIPSFFRPLALVVTFIVAYLLVCMNLYVFPMMVSFDLPLKKLIKNSLILAMYKIWHNLAMILFALAIAALCFILGLLAVPIILTLVFSLVCLFNNFMVYPLLVKYVATPEEKKPEADEEEQIFSDDRRIK
jgi:uncharacterized membrane protein YesL